MSINSCSRMLILLAFLSLSSACKKPVEHPDPINNLNITDDSKNYTVSTILSNITTSIDPLTGLPFKLEFNGPLVCDAQGNLYTTYRYRIIKINSAKIISDYAGSIQGFADGAANNAKFDDILAMTLDTQGNLYVSEKSRVRKISPSGVVTTVAGTGVAGYTDGDAAMAQFGVINSLVADRSGNIYLTDELYYSIRKISPSGIVSTLAGDEQLFGSQDGPGKDARFTMPRGLSIDSDYNIYVSDAMANRIRKITPAGMVTTVFSLFEAMYHIARDQFGNLYVIGGRSIQSIYRVSLTGAITKICGGIKGNTDGPGNQASFQEISGIALHPNGDIYVREFNPFIDYAAIRKISKN